MLRNCLTNICLYSSECIFNAQSDDSNEKFYVKRFTKKFDNLGLWSAHQASRGRLKSYSTATQKSINHHPLHESRQENLKKLFTCVIVFMDM